MNDRIHSWLDGEIPLEALAPEERRRAFRIHGWLRAAEELREETPRRVADDVMRALPQGPPAPGPESRWERLTAALQGLRQGFSYRPVPLRHAATMAGVCLAVGFGLGLWGAPDGSTLPPLDSRGAATAAAASSAAPVYVRFDLQVADAQSVRLAGSFSDWEPAYELTAAGDGRWTITIPLEPGVHDYVFVVDGDQHLLDPTAPRIADGFGGFSNRLALLTTAT